MPSLTTGIAEIHKGRRYDADPFFRPQYTKRIHALSDVDKRDRPDTYSH